MCLLTLEARTGVVANPIFDSLFQFSRVLVVLVLTGGSVEAMSVTRGHKTYAIFSTIETARPQSQRFQSRSCDEQFQLDFQISTQNGKSFKRADWPTKNSHGAVLTSEMAARHPQGIPALEQVNPNLFVVSHFLNNDAGRNRKVGLHIRMMSERRTLTFLRPSQALGTGFLRL